MLVPVNDNFNSSCSMTGFTLQNVYPVELTLSRFTALVTLSKNTSLPFTEFASTSNAPDPWQGLELLVVEGSCSIDKDTHHQGCYLRIPLASKTLIKATTDCILFIKCNQFLHEDDGFRTIKTHNADKWLPGPAEGIEIMPLHVFDTESIMLLRWQQAAEFRPRLNPRGEEILVVNGLLQNRDHLYRQYSWIRNPIEDWRKWHGNTGTLIYYKSGHFPADPNGNDSN